MPCPTKLIGLRELTEEGSRRPRDADGEVSEVTNARL